MSQAVIQFDIDSFSRSTHIAAEYLSERLSARQKQSPVALIFVEDVRTAEFALICGSYGSDGLTPESYSEIKPLRYTHAIMFSTGWSSVLNAI